MTAQIVNVLIHLQMFFIHCKGYLLVKLFPKVQVSCLVIIEYKALLQKKLFEDVRTLRGVRC